MRSNAPPAQYACTRACIPKRTLLHAGCSVSVRLQPCQEPWRRELPAQAALSRPELVKRKLLSRAAHLIAHGHAASLQSEAQRVYHFRGAPALLSNLTLFYRAHAWQHYCSRGGRCIRDKPHGPAERSQFPFRSQPPGHCQQAATVGRDCASGGNECASNCSSGSCSRGTRSTVSSCQDAAAP